MATPEIRAEILNNLKAKAASLPEENILKVALASSLERINLTKSVNTYRDLANILKSCLDVPDLVIWSEDVRSFGEKGQESTKIKQIERAILASQMEQEMRNGNLAPVASSMLSTITEIGSKNPVLQDNTLDMILLRNLVGRWDYRGIAENMLIAMISGDKNNSQLHKKDLHKEIAKVLPDWFSTLEKSFQQKR